MEFLQTKRGHCNEEQEQNEEEVIRDAGNLPISYSSWSYGSSNCQSLCSGRPSFIVCEEDATRSHHGAAATKIQEEELKNGTPTSTNDKSYRHAGRSSGAGDGSWSMEKEHMFDKVVTPSDVGKLNRLVIPKQQAEKYFPLDSSANEKGLLLNFEDRSGKPWQFKYSYWNSSQSYVITKGWSRFVKEKQLDAGDIVSFQRGVGESDKDRLFIDWRHRLDVPDPTLVSSVQFPISPSPLWGRLFPLPPSMSMPMLRPYLHHQNQKHHSCCNSTHNYSAINLGQGGAVPQIGDIPRIVNSAPVVHRIAAAPKRLRLFGVNMDCPVSQESKGMELPSVPYVTTATVFYPRPHFCSLIPPQLRLHDGAPTLQPELLGKGQASQSFNLNI